MKLSGVKKEEDLILFQFVFSWHDSPYWARAFSLSRLHDQTQKNRIPEDSPGE
jgi:hypothetical protein